MDPKILELFCSLSLDQQEAVIARMKDLLRQQEHGGMPMGCNLSLQVFQNPQFGKVRTITENGVTLFCGSDVAKALGYKNPSKALMDHCKGAIERRTNDSLGRQQNMKFIPEGDIYRLAARSDLPGADAFERWIFDEVLPSIRKTGSYNMAGEVRIIPKAQPEVPLIGLAKVTAAARKAVLDVGGTRQDAGMEVLHILEHCGFPVPEFARKDRIVLELSDFCDSP